MLRSRGLFVVVFILLSILLGGLVVLVATDAFAPASSPTSTHTPTPTLALPLPTVVASTATPDVSPTFIIFTSAPPSTLTVTPPATATVLPELSAPSLPTATGAEVAAAATATLTPLPLVAQSLPEAFRAHFLMTRPIPPDPAYTNFASRNYPYGSTGGGAYQVHHGLDLDNATGTPVRAVAEGRVYYAGTDLETKFGPQLNFYGKLVLIEHDITVGDGSRVYSLYGHLSKVKVHTGDHVALYDTLGEVGATGVAYGSHLHFEVRVGSPRDYFATRNPDLWIQNFNGFGVLAGRLVDGQGQPRSDVRIEINASSAGVQRVFTSYADPNLPGDDVLNENFAIGDLPADDYEIMVVYDGGSYRDTVTVYADRVAWLDIVLP